MSSCRKAGKQNFLFARERSEGEEQEQEMEKKLDTFSVFFVLSSPVV
jgi:hypothetical protein